MENEKVKFSLYHLLYQMGITFKGKEEGEVLFSYFILLYQMEILLMETEEV